MDFTKIIHAREKPEVYEPGDAVMWTDDHISGELLKMHLDPEIDSASRKRESIEKTHQFITKHCTHPGMHVLDLGCGPGLYTEKLALTGHQVTGIDFSSNSIAYARKHAAEKELDIMYVCQNYLEIEYTERFDLVIMIYTDFGVLIPSDRYRLLKNVYRALKPGGMFIFDVINDKNLEEKFPEQHAWTVSEGGFWRKRPYLELINGFLYPDHHVYLMQHTILDEDDHCVRYRFWTHYFNPDMLTPEISDLGFDHIRYFDDVLPEGDTWNGDNITFFLCKKPE